ncbi:MAG: hypothetical protein IJ258_10240 [Methanobrevibacter sp.]|uniref:hypothetical protein n=1 Tax=Methanobrevibacter sp. TaxID=66852 RepID=UPI0025F6188C|nr:hypothetical protein [Methanobrevibacter sp.]MBQ8018464.1 hypothetical protein [Methanobrevibacter sp.]
MNKKLSAVIIIAVILIIVGGYLIITNPFSEKVIDESSITLKPHDFDSFSIDIPEGSNFTIQNEMDGMKSYQNNGSYGDNFSRIIINKNLTDSLIGDNSQSILNTSEEQVYSSVFKNDTIYKYVSIHDGVDIILIGDDLNLLKEIADTIEIKDVKNL